MYIMYIQRSTLINAQSKLLDIENLKQTTWAQIATDFETIMIYIFTIKLPVTIVIRDLR